MNGKGVYQYANGDVFEGMWICGKKHGRGELTGSDGRTMIGEWVEDQFSEWKERESDTSNNIYQKNFWV